MNHYGTDDAREIAETRWNNVVEAFHELEPVTQVIVDDMPRDLAEAVATIGDILTSTMDLLNRLLNLEKR